MFRLLYHFSLTSAVVIVVVITLLMIFFRHLSVEDLVNVGERQNEILTRSIGNFVWTEFGPHLRSIKGADRNTVIRQARTEEISRKLLPQIMGLPVLRVEMINLTGVIVFSTQRDRIGQDRSGDTGFSAAREGRAASKISAMANSAQAIGDVDVLSSYVPFRDADGTVVGVFHIYSDITQLLADIDKHVLHVLIALLAALGLLYIVLYQVVRRADKTLRKQHLELQSSEKELRQAMADAENSSRAKSQIMANMSHELRTPLNAIIGYSSTMSSEMFGPLDEKYKGYARDIHRSGEHLLGLITDILDVSAIEAGKLDLYEENLNAGTVTEDALRMVGFRSDEGHLHLSSQIDEGLPLLRADRRRLTQILINLLSNAIKFTPTGGAVSVGVSVDLENAFVFTVRDTGVGMDEEEQAEVMAKFGQVDSGFDRKNEGIGLGLPLTEGLIELHDGTFEMASEKGKGTTVTVRFPPDRTVTP